MSALPISPGRLAFILAAAFAVGGGSAEVAVRAHKAVVMARPELERAPDDAGQLVALDLVDPSGEVVARPRLLAPSGRRAELVLHDPAHPREVRLSLKVEATREPSGEIALDYTLWLPDRSLHATGSLLLAPGVEQTIALGDGELYATLLAVPAPSAAFDAFMESERARHATPAPS